MGAVLLPVVGLLIIATLIILFYSKKHVNNNEINIYSKLLILTTIFIIVGLIAFIVAKATNDLTLVGLFQKIYMSILIILNYYSIKYCLLIFDIDIKKAKIINISLNTITVIAIILILLLPLNVIYYDNVLDGSGLSYDVALVYSIFSFLIFVGLTLYLLLTKHTIEKIMPFLILVVLYCFGFLLRSLYHELIFEGFFYSYILLIMYHTIENPDLKTINQLELAKNTAEKANRAKSDFLSSMSHEIRTPLNTIVGLSEIVASYDNIPKEILADITDIKDASDTLLEIVGNILDINKIESENMEIVLSEYNFKEEISELVEVLIQKIDNKPIDFELVFDKDIPDVLIGDKTHVKVIVNNLLSNAIKYTEKGKITLIVKCINKNDISNLTISVEDTGRGIKEENIERLFNKFERLEEDKNTTIEGTGLGLAITKSLVNLMGGTINVNSTLGKGSIFVVNLPQKISKMTDSSSEEKSYNYYKKANVIESNEDVEVLSDDTTQENKIKILIVDDNKMNVKVAYKLLADLPYTIEGCNSGIECLNNIKNGNHYDLILMDIMMPEKSGEDTLKELKSIPNFTTPIIALTADVVVGAKEKYISEGFSDYLGKPFKKEELIEKVNKVLNNKLNNQAPIEWDNVPSTIITEELKSNKNII